MVALKIFYLSYATSVSYKLPGCMASRKYYRQLQQYPCYSHGQGLKWLRYQQLEAEDLLVFQAKQALYFP